MRFRVNLLHVISCIWAKIKTIDFLLSKLSACFIFCSVFYVIQDQEKWTTKDGYVVNDVKGYYAYLPYTFILDDIKFETANNAKVWFSTDEEKDVRFMKYTTGMSLVYAPGFFIAHGFATLFELDNNGYSLAYQLSFIFTALLFVFLALLLSIKFLSLHFKDHITALTLLILFLGTNLFHYSTSYLSFAHLYSFTLILAFCFFSIKWLNKPTWKRSFLIGILVGWFILIRPIDIIFVLFPFVYNISSLSDFKARIKVLSKHLKQFLLISIGAVIIWIPQFIYLFTVFGELKLNTYSQEKFFFDSPNLLNTLFSFRDGWLVYSPLMIISVIGLLFLLFKKKHLGYFLMILTYWFILSSWWCWWYQGFGNRAFINLYPMLILPLAFGLTLLFKKKPIKILSLFVIAFGLFLSLFQTLQFEHGSYTPGRMTYESYKENFLTKQASMYFYELLETVDMDSAILGKDYVYRHVYDTIKTVSISSKDVNQIKTKGYIHVFDLPLLGANAINIKVGSNKKLNAEDYLLIKSKNEAFNISQFSRVKTSLFSNPEIQFDARQNEVIRFDTVEVFILKNNTSQYELANFRVNWLNRKKILIKDSH